MQQYKQKTENIFVYRKRQMGEIQKCMKVKLN